MTDRLPEPYLIVDANDLENRRLYETPWHGEFLAWMRSQGMDPAATHLVEVYVVDCPFARISVYAKDGQGRSILAEDGESYVKHVERVPLSSLPPLPEVSQ